MIEEDFSKKLNVFLCKNTIEIIKTFNLSLNLKDLQKFSKTQGSQKFDHWSFLRIK